MEPDLKEPDVKVAMALEIEINHEIGTKASGEYHKDLGGLPCPCTEGTFSNSQYELMLSEWEAENKAENRAMVRSTLKQDETSLGRDRSRGQGQEQFITCLISDLINRLEEGEGRRN